jgi:hypothetical protein
VVISSFFWNFSVVICRVLGGEDPSHPVSGKKLDSQSCGNNLFLFIFSLVICCGLGEKTLLTHSHVKSLIAKVVV